MEKLSLMVDKTNSINDLTFSMTDKAFEFTSIPFFMTDKTNSLTEKPWLLTDKTKSMKKEPLSVKGKPLLSTDHCPSVMEIVPSVAKFSGFNSTKIETGVSKNDA